MTWRPITEPDVMGGLIAMSGDVHPNPGPQRRSQQHIRPPPPPTQRHLRVLQVNVNGWRARQGALEHLLREQRPDVVLLQETKIKPGDRTPPTPGFAALRRDRTIHRGGNAQPQGGLATLVREGLPYEAIEIGLPGGACLELQGVKVYTNTKTKTAVNIFNIYRPPVRTNNERDQRDASLHTASWPSDQRSFVMGDINGHGTWDSSRGEDEVGREVDDWMADNTWTAFKTGGPTRLGAHGEGTAPDITIGHACWANRVS